MVNTNILDNRYRFFGETTPAEQFRKEWADYLENNNLEGRIILNNAPNRIGKTITTLKSLEKTDAKILYLADRHNHISEVEATLNNPRVVHWWGMRKLCQQKDNPSYNFLIENHVPAGFTCQSCMYKKECPYWMQWHINEDSIVGAPKELLPTKYVSKNDWDYIIFDEIIDKAQRVEPYCKPIKNETMDSHNLTLLKITYDILKDIIGDQTTADEETLSYFKEELKDINSNYLPRLIRQIKYEGHIDNDIKPVLGLMSRFRSTVEWLELCAEHGFKTHFYKPYLYDVLDLQNKYQSNVILLNTSLKNQFYEKMVSNYQYQLPTVEEFPFHFENKNSLLLHYNYKARSCSKIGLDNYGAEIYIMAKNLIRFGNKKGLKTGIITFKNQNHIFTKETDVVSYFGGHQGSNTFDDVDLLIILGTYHINPDGLYQKYFMLTNQLLIDDPARWNNFQHINGARITLSDNTLLNELKLYKLNEEHGQAIFRSGAHVQNGKIVIVFGYVPEDVTNILEYNKFRTEKGAKISISKWLKKTKHHK